jgi:KDO2-lipid IV(A) lauroyltransferase
LYGWIGKIVKNDSVLENAGRLLKYLPQPLIHLCCRAACRLMCVFAVPLRKQVKQNMDELLGNKSQEQISCFSRNYFYNLLITLYEILIESYALDRIKDIKFRTEGEIHLREVLNLGRGAIIFAPHMGNFFYYYWYLSKYYPCLTVVTAGSDELRPLYLMFQRFGCSGLDYDSTSPLKLLRALRSHLKGNGVVFLLGDFWRPVFPLSTMFGRPMRSPAGTAALALENQIPVIPFYGYREQTFKHRLVFRQPIFLHEEFKTHQRAEATKRLNLFLEQVVTEWPEQWFYWFNVNERWEIGGTCHSPGYL